MSLFVITVLDTVPCVIVVVVHYLFSLSVCLSHLCLCLEVDML